MHFELNERIVTGFSRSVVEEATLRQFKMVSEEAFIDNGRILIRGVSATFGSVQRRDEGVVRIGEVEDGFNIAAEIEYGPSFVFWLFIILGLFGYVVGSLIPMGFYLYHQRLVRSTVQDALSGLETELRTAPRPRAPTLSIAEEIGKLAALRDSGVLTTEEFDTKKRQLLA